MLRNLSETELELVNGGRKKDSIAMIVVSSLLFCGIVGGCIYVGVDSRRSNESTTNTKNRPNAKNKPVMEDEGVQTQETALSFKNNVLADKNAYYLPDNAIGMIKSTETDEMMYIYDEDYLFKQRHPGF